ncbi:MAG: hypothetical protein J2P21_06505 [Chloracidobacterium sp.]|nr:hypothetical protein [Chloracidobacterium sp.]
MASAFPVTRLMTGLIYGLGPADPLTFAGATLLLSAVALAACGFRRDGRRKWIR